MTKSKTKKPTAVVITPTTGSPKVLDAIQSVHDQTYPTQHVVVVDGDIFKKEYDDVVGNYQFSKFSNKAYFPEVVYLKENVGAAGFYGHRIFAAFSHLVNEDYVFFLDQDNWYEPNHIEKFMDMFANEPELAWGYSLRNIYDKNRKLLGRDNCESLGKYPVWQDDNSFHVDTSSYGFNRQFLIQVASLWHGGYAQDRKFFNILKTNFRPEIWQTTGHYTLNYRLDGNPTSASPEFFLKGNEVMKGRYNHQVTGYPWNKEDNQL